MMRNREERRPSDIFLKYHGICLTVDEVNCLKDDWLTDNNISFYQEYLEHHELKKYPSSKIILLRPAMVEMIKSINNSNALAAVQTGLPGLKEASHIFLPINDNPNPEVAEGGSHWSLLVVGVYDGVAFHYDSLMDSNDAVARKVNSLLQKLLDQKLRFLSLPDTPQQENSMDCGMHVCMNMKHLLLNRLLLATSKESVDMSMGGRRQDATQGRRDMLKLIEKLRAKALRK
ncbi:hypothetical protein BDZ91DRAFT_448849 [Kalaharituber pfeilii]|nr:hypothetical protein BDZ91DRAFT_448849 [Kalaharituber pfeilii]